MAVNGQQTFNTAFPFDVKIQNQFNGEDLAVLYIVDSTSTAQAAITAQQVTFAISITDSNNYSFAALNLGGTSFSSFVPSAQTFHFAVVIRPGTLRDDVVSNFANLLKTALTTTLTSVSPNNAVVVSGPVTRLSDGALIWYCAFQSTFSIPVSGFNVGLSSVAAASGAGSRSSQIEFLFSSVLLANTGNSLSFSRSKSVDIINHQGSSYAPIYFSIKGETQLLNKLKYPNVLSVYFETSDRTPIQFGENSQIVFSFPYLPSAVNGQAAPLVSAMHFGSNSEVMSYCLDQPSDNSFTGFGQSGKDNNDGLVQFTVTFPSTGLVDNSDYKSLESSIVVQNSFVSESLALVQTITKSFAPSNVSLPSYISTCISNLNNKSQNYTLYNQINNIGGKNQGKGTFNVSQPFSVANFISAYQFAINWIQTNGLDSSLLTSSPAGNMEGSCGTTSAWSTDFVNYVSNNYTTLINNLISNNAVSVRTIMTNDEIPYSYILPSQTLYDFFWGYYQNYLANVPPYVLNINDFSSVNWTNAINSAAAYLASIKSGTNLYSSAQGVTSNYAQNSSWPQSLFTSYVVQNFATLCKGMVNCTFAINSNLYIVPSQALFDYLWFNFQVTTLTSQLSDTPQKISAYPSFFNHVFNFSGLQISGDDGIVMLSVSVRGLPDYWDTDLLVPVIKEKYADSSDFELNNTTTPGKILIPANDPNYPTANGVTQFGSRIDFLSSSNYAVAIEEYYGLNIFGSLPTAGTVSPAGVPSQAGTPASTGQPVRIRNADLLVVEGRLGINNVPQGDLSGDFTNPNNIFGGENINEKLRVNGDTYLNGHLGINGDLGVAGTSTFSGQVVVETVNDGQTFPLVITVSNPQSTGAVITVDYDGNCVSLGNVSSGNNYTFDAKQGNGRSYDKYGPLMPVGSILPYAGGGNKALGVAPTLPAGWLLCDGQTTVNPQSYPELYQLLGGTLNSGQTIYTPDLRGRTLIGTGGPNNNIQSDGRIPNVNGYNWPLGYTGGEFWHTLTEAEMPEHNHQYKTLLQEMPQSGSDTMCWSGGETASTSSTGGSQAHNIMQPYYAVNYIIKC